MALETEHNLGSNNEGVDGATTTGSPVDNSNYYTFDGSADGLYYSSDYGDETAIDIYAKFRVHNKGSGTAQIIWKSGGHGGGIAIGMDASGNLGIFGNNGGSVTSNTVASENVPENAWLELRASKSRIKLVDVDAGTVIGDYESSITVSAGGAEESIAYGEFLSGSGGTSPITATESYEWFDGDIDFIEIWSEGTLGFPVYFPLVSGTLYERAGSTIQRDYAVIEIDTATPAFTIKDAAQSATDGSFSVDVADTTTRHINLRLDNTGTYKPDIQDYVTSSDAESEAGTSYTEPSYPGGSNTYTVRHELYQSDGTTLVSGGTEGFFAIAWYYPSRDISQFCFGEQTTCDANGDASFSSLTTGIHIITYLDPDGNEWPYAHEIEII